MHTSKLILAFVLVIVLAALGCKSEQHVKPLGQWTKNTTSAQSESPGILEFKDNSHFSFTTTQEGHNNTMGRYSLKEGEITIEDDSCYNPGSYNYMLENSQLTLELISDSCEQRAIVLSGTWRRTSAGK